MSEFEHYSPETFGELAEIERKICQLAELFDSGAISEETKPVLLSSIEALQAKAAELAGTDTISVAVSQISESNQRLSTELDQIAKIIGDESLLGEDYRQKREAVVITQESLASFAERYPNAELIAREAGGTALAITEGPEPAEASVPEFTAEPLGTTDGEQAVISPELRGKTQVELTFAHNVVRLGHQGKVIPYCNRSHEGQTDYSDIRRKALMFMVSAGNQKVTPLQIWEAANPGKTFDQAQMTEVRRWFDKLTYRRAKLIAHHKRGPGSRYWVDPRFELSMGFDMDEPVSGAGEINDEITTETIEPAKRIYEFDYGDGYLLAVQLHKFNDVLAAYNCGEITEEMLAAMSKYSPDLSHLKGDTQAILAYRSAAQARVGEFIADEGKLLRFLDKVKIDSPILGFVEFLSDLDEDQRKLVNRLVLAKRESKIKGTPRGIVELPEEPAIIDSEGWEIRIPKHPCDPVRPSGSTEIEKVEESSEVSVQEEEPEQAPGVKEEQSRPEADRDAEVIAQLKEKIIEYSIIWADNNLDPEKTQPSRRLAKAYHSNSFSQRNLAAKFTRSRFKNGGIGFVDAVTILLVNDSTLRSYVKKYSSQIKEIAEAAQQDLVAQKAAKS